MEFKVGQKVTILGRDCWHSKAKKDIGKIATVTKIYTPQKHWCQDDYLLVVQVNNKPGTQWVITNLSEIKLAIRPGEQLLFKFMEEK